MKIKTKKPDAMHVMHVCAVSRCETEAVVVDASKRRWPDPVPLCAKHWTQATEISTPQGK